MERDQHRSKESALLFVQSLCLPNGSTVEHVGQLADAYIHAGGTRIARTQQSLLELGVSVLAGANTTNLAGLPLWLGMTQHIMSTYSTVSHTLGIP
jgi:hypothetical protein